MLRIVIVDEDEERGEFLSQLYRTNGATSAASATCRTSVRRFIKRHRPNVILMLHPLSGPYCLSYLSQARQTGAYIVSAVPEGASISRLIESVSDTVFPLEEILALKESFLAILEGLLTRSRFEGAGRNGYRFNRLFADIDRGAVYYGETAVPLSPIEYQILCLLVMQRGEPIDKREIMKQVWGTAAPTSRTLLTHISNLRKRLREHCPEYEIVSEPEGYRIAARPRRGRR